MPILGVFSALEHTQKHTPSWIRDVAVMLAGESVSTVVVATGTEFSEPLLDPIERDECKAGNLPTVEDVHAGRPVDPYALPAHPGLSLLAARDLRYRFGSEAQQTQLAAWMQARDESVVIVPLGSDWNHGVLVEACTHYVVLAHTTIASLQLVRDLGHRWQHLRRPTCYALLQAPLSPINGNESARVRRLVERTLPGAFRSAWLGKGESADFTAQADHMAVGVVHARAPTELPAWRMGRDTEVSDSQAAQARFQTLRLAQNLAAFLELELDLTPPTPVFADATHPLDIERVVGPEQAARAPGFLPAVIYQSVLDCVRTHRLTVLLGESGVGKTYVSKQLEQELDAGRVDLREETSLRDALEGVTASVLVLDGLDEHEGFERGSFAHQLKTAFEAGRDKLIICARPHKHVVEVLIPELRRWVAPAQFVCQWLLPLTREDARQVALAYTTLRDGAERRLTEDQVRLFFEEVRRSELTGLAANPLMLGLLLERLVDGLRLTADRDVLFGHLVEDLAGRKRGDVAPVLRAAEAMAWATIIGEYGSPAALPRERFLAAFGLESTHFEAAQDRFGQVHRSVWEHLAAGWAIRKQVPATRLREVLTIDGRHIVDRFKYVVARLVASNAALAELLIEADPTLLLEVGARVHADQRLAWLRALIRAHESGEIPLQHRSLKGFAEDTLTPSIRAGLYAEVLDQLSTQDPALREALVRLLPVGGLQGRQQILRIAADASEQDPVREAALWALDTDFVTEQKIALTALWHTDPIPPPAIRARLLTMLWPIGALQGIEVIRRTAYTFNARFFMGRNADAIIDDIPVDNLPEALEWVARRQWVDEEDHPGTIRLWAGVGELVTYAWTLSALSSVRDALASLMLRWARANILDWLPIDWGSDPARLWSLIRVMMRLDDAPTMKEHFWWQLPIAQALKVDWLVDDMERSLAADPAEFERWGVYWSRIRNWGEHLLRVKAMARRHAGLAEQLARLEEPMTPSRRSNSELTVDEPDTKQSKLDIVRRRLAEAQQDVRYWVVFSQAMQRTGSLTGQSTGPFPLTQTHGWPALTDVERATAIELAGRFIDAPETEITDVVEGSRWCNDLRQAWVLKLTAGSEPTLDTWRRWLPKLLAWWPFKSIDIVRHARQALGDRFASAVLQSIEASDEPCGSLFERLEPYWTSVLPAAALARLHPIDKDDRVYEEMRRLLAVLLRRAPDRALKWADIHFDVDWILRTCVYNASVATWDRIWLRFARDGEFSARLLKLATDGYSSRWWDAGQPERIAIICERVHIQFPEAPRPTGRGLERDTVTANERARWCLTPMIDDLIRQNAVEQVRHLHTVMDLPAGYIRRAERHRQRAPRDMYALARVSPKPESAEALMWLVVDTLRLIQNHDLEGGLTVRELFFENKPEPQEDGQPVTEADDKRRRLHEVKACQLLAKLLQLRLPEGVTLLLEPQKSEARSRLDVQVVGARASVIIEVKWADHAQVASALTDQLAGNYLAAESKAAGVYLVLWYEHAMLGDAVRYPIAPAWRNPDDLAKDLRRRADGTHALIEPVILKLRRPRSTPG